MLSFFVSVLVLKSVVFADNVANKKAEVDSVNAIPYEFIVSNLQKSLVIFTKNVGLAQSIEYKYGEAVASDKLAMAKGLSGNHDEATEATFKAMRIYEENKVVDELSMLYGEYGYRIKRRDLPKAITYMRKGVKLAEESNLKKNLTALYDNYGVVIQMDGKPDSALYFFEKALHLKYELKDSIGIPYSLNKIAESYAEKGRFKKALQYLKDSDKIRATEKGDYGRTENLIMHAELNTMMKQYDSAVSYYIKAIEKGKVVGHHYLIQYCYEQLSQLYEQQNKYDLALDKYKKFTAYKDSIVNVETNTKISELQIAFETEKKDRQIAENEVELKNKSIQLFLAIIVVLIILGSLIFTFWYYKQKHIRLKKDLEFKNQLKQAELEKKISDEKLHISRELHDNIGSNLTFMISSIDNLGYLAKNDAMLPKLKKLSEFGRETIEDLRNSIWAIKKEAGDTDQLVLKINDLKQKINENLTKPEILVLNKLEVPFQLSSTQMLNLYRFVQEAVHNSVKHADASQIIITLLPCNEGFGITVEDDGKGFDVKAASYGNGLNNMKTRCEESGARFEIDSSQNGTRVALTINM